MHGENGIVLAYIGVHQIFQLALAAQEAGRLSALYCSLIDRPGYLGKWITKVFPNATCQPLGGELIASRALREIPYPLLKRSLGRRVPLPRSSVNATNDIFDSLVARHVACSKSRVFVGVETCCQRAFEVNKAKGGINVLECPGIPSRLLNASIQAANELLGMPSSVTPLAVASGERKERELNLADHVILCSEIQRTEFLKCGIGGDRLHVNPLWVDPQFHVHNNVIQNRNCSKLKILFVGRGSVAKGLPFYLQAKESLGDRHFEWTVVGGVDKDVSEWAGSRLAGVRVVPWVSRSKLRQIYAGHHVLVFPSLGDSFGFTVMEAMAAGLPVVVTEHVGAPVPGQGWRIPVMDPSSIADRLSMYQSNYHLLQQHSMIAKEFAATYTPEAYRERARQLFEIMLPTQVSRSPEKARL